MCFYAQHQISASPSKCLLSICAHIRCICGLLKDKCRILVTHQLQHLRAADHILLLQEVSQLSTKNWFSLYRCLTSLTLSGSHRDSGHLQAFSALRPRCQALDEEQDKYSQIAELEKQSIHSQKTNCSFGSLLSPDCSVTVVHFPMVKNTSLKPLMNFCFFQRQKRFLPCQRRLELRETLVGTFTTSTSLQAAATWF